MYFQDTDRFLINRLYDGNINHTSSTMEALTIKNIVNPVGNVTQPLIRQPTENQGFPIKSTPIIRNVGVIGSVVTLKLENLQGLDLVGAPDVTLSEPIVSTESYTPITTSISQVDKTGNDYEIYFNPINYDFQYFEVGEEVHIVGESTVYTIDSLDTSKGTMIINTTTDFTQYQGDKIESKKEIKSEGILIKYYVHNEDKKDYRCDIDTTDPWVSSPHNNRRQEMTFDTTKPKGGSHVDLNGARFEADPFECDNPVLHLTEVTWRLNGVEFKVPITDKEGVQYWDVPPEAMIEDAINAVSVVYMAGQNSSRDKNNPNTVYFIPKSNPTRLANSVELLNNIETFITEVTTLGL